MKCLYCGAKKEKGDKFVWDAKNKGEFCSLSHLREWVKRHTGTNYFRAVTKTVQE